MASRAFRRSTVLVGWLVGAFAISASAQSFDNSGTANLSGDYFVRQVLLANLDQNTSAVGRALSIVGIMTFDGAGLCRALPGFIK